jgi:PAS domain-containing protein
LAPSITQPLAEAFGAAGEGRTRAEFRAEIPHKSGCVGVVVCTMAPVDANLKLAMALDFEAILGRLEVAIIVHDRATRILFANKRASELLGVGPESLLKADSFDPKWDCIDEAGEPVSAEQQPNVVATRTKLL